MYCLKCGQELHEGTKVCPKCFAKVCEIKGINKTFFIIAGIILFILISIPIGVNCYEYIRVKEIRYDNRDKMVKFNNKEVEEAVINYSNHSDTDKYFVTNEEVNKLTYIEIEHKGILNFNGNLNQKYMEDLCKLKNLDYLSLYNVKINDVSKLKSLSNLTNIDLKDSKISNMGMFKCLKHLKSLRMYNCKISDFSGLEDLKQLKYLTIEDCGLKDKDICRLKDFSSLIELHLPDNKISNIDPLEEAYFPLIKYISLEGNSLNEEDISEIKNCYPDCRIYCDDGK